MPESTVPRTLRDGVIVISDSGAANTYTVAIEPGDFAYEAPVHDLVIIRDRSALHAFRKGDDQPVTTSFSVHYRDPGDTAAAYATLPDIVEQYAGAHVTSNWTSTLGNASDVKTWSLAYTIDGSAFGEADKTLTFNHGYFQGSYSEGSPSTYSVSGQHLITKPTLS